MTKTEKEMNQENKEALKKLPKDQAKKIKKVLGQKLKSEDKKRKEAEEHKPLKINHSIHPRVVAGRTQYEKVNTCKPKSGPKAKKVQNIQEHLERHPHDAAAQKLLQKKMAA